MSVPRSSGEWAEVYAEVQPTYQAFTERLDTLLETLLEDEGLSSWSVFSWSLSVDGFEEAIDRSRRAGRAIDDAFADLEDVAGVSIVVYTLGDAARVGELVERELAVEASPSDAEPEGGSALRAVGDVTAFSYPFARYSVTLDENRAALAEWRPFAGLRAEIHVMTLMQYVWNEIDRDMLPYSWSRSYAPQTRAACSRVTTLLEDADEALEDAVRRSDEVVEEYADNLAAGLDVDLNAPSLAAYLLASDSVAELIRLAEEAGMQHYDEPAVLAPWSLEQRLLWVLERHGISTLADLDRFLRDAADRAPGILGEIARLASDRGYVPFAVSESLVTWLVLVLHRAGAETVALTSYREELDYALNTLIGNAVPTEGDAQQR